MEMTYGEGKWREQAYCRGHETALFFDQLRRDKAIALCEACLVKTDCLEDRMATTDRWEDDPGIWGGTTSTERAAMRKGQNGRRRNVS